MRHSLHSPLESRVQCITANALRHSYFHADVTLFSVYFSAGCAVRQVVVFGITKVSFGSNFVK